MGRRTLVAICLIGAAGLAVIAIWRTLAIQPQQIDERGSPAPPGDHGPGLSGAGGIHVVDSRGQTVGAFVMAMTPFDVPIEAALRDIKGTPAVLPVSPGGFPAPCCDIPYLYLGVYESLDCSGTRYVDAWNRLLVPLPALIGDDTIVYPSATIRSLTVNSKLEWTDGNPQLPPTCRHVSYPTSVKEVLTVDLASLGLIPPFSVR